MGRLLRIPYFSGQDGDEKEKAQLKLMTAARRAISREDKQIAAAHTIELLAGAGTGYEEPESKTHARKVIGDWICKIQMGYGGRVVRRTVNSKTHDGKKINDTLPPYDMTMFAVHLNEEELHIIGETLNAITST